MVKKVKKTKKKSKLKKQRRHAFKSYYQRIRWVVLQHYSKQETPACEFCGCPHLAELHLHHLGGGRAWQRGSGSQLKKEEGFKVTDSVKYWKWLIEHRYPKKHEQKVLCSTCHWMAHIMIRRGLIKKLNKRLELYKHLPESPVPTWFLRRIEDVTEYKMVKKQDENGKETFGSKEWWQAEPPIRWLKRAGDFAAQLDG